MWNCNNPSNDIEGIWPQEENTVLFNKWPRSLLDNWYKEHTTLPTELSSRHPSNTTCVIDNQTILLPNSNEVNSNSSSSIEPVLESTVNLPSQNFFYLSNVPSFSTERIINSVENNSVISNEPNFVDLIRATKNPTGNVGQNVGPISISNSNIPSFTSNVGTYINSYFSSDRPQYYSDPTIDESSKNSQSTQTTISMNNELQSESYNCKMPLNCPNQYKLMRCLPNYHYFNGKNMFNPNSPMSQVQPIDTEESLPKMYKTMRNILMTNGSVQTNTTPQPPRPASLGNQVFRPREESLDDTKTYSVAVRKNPINVTKHSDSEDIKIKLNSIKHFPGLPEKQSYLTSNAGLNDSNMNRNCLNNVEYTDYKPQGTNKVSQESSSYINTENTLNVLELNNLISLYKQNSINESNQYSPQLHTSQIVCSSEAILVHSGPKYTMAPNSVQLRFSDDIYRKDSNKILYNTLNSRKGVPQRTKNFRNNIPPQVVGNTIDNGNQFVCGGTRIFKPYIIETERKLFCYQSGVQSARTLGAQNATTSGIQDADRLVAQSTSIRGVQNSTPIEYRLQHDLGRSHLYGLSTVVKNNDQYTIGSKKLDHNRRVILNNFITGVIPNPNSLSGSIIPSSVPSASGASSGQLLVSARLRGGIINSKSC